MKSYIWSINIVTVIIKQFKYRKATTTTRNLLKIITLNVYKTKLCFNNEVKAINKTKEVKSLKWYKTKYFTY